MSSSDRSADFPTPAACTVPDLDFEPNAALLSMGVNRLTQRPGSSRTCPPRLNLRINEIGLGTAAAIEQAAELVIGHAQRLDVSQTFAHMDPPAPLVSWIGELWNARLNQNLLHAETSPAARLIEEHVIEWLAPWFGMGGGHFASGSTLANLTALWAAREIGGVKEVVASEAAHVSVAKAAYLLGLAYRCVATNAEGVLDPGALPADLSRSALVLTAGATSTGAIDPLKMTRRSAWTHVDAAWAGPLRLCESHRHLLEGVQGTDSISISAHKLMFQPKGSAVVLFRDVSAAHRALSFGAGYLSSPNVGLHGSRPAVAVPLYLTLLAWGRQGLVERINRCMAASKSFADWVTTQSMLELFAAPVTGVVLWRSRRETADDLQRRLPVGLASTTTVSGERWIRNVAANPSVNVEDVITAVSSAVHCRGLIGCLPT